MTRIRWSLREEVASLLAEGELPLAPAAVVKGAPHRTVYRVVAGGLDVHVKHYRADRRERWRELFRPSKARAEHDLGRAVARRGVPTLEVLGYGEGDGESFLITRTLPGAVSLLDHLGGELPPRERQALARAVGRLLAAAHRAGACHHDLHPGNVLLNHTPTGPALYLIDLHAVRLGAPLSWPASRDNLVLLERWAAPRLGQADRRRVWKAYLAARPELGVPERGGAAEVQACAARSALRFNRQLDRRCLGGNRHYRAIPGGYAVAELAELPAGPAAEARVLKHSPSSTVAVLTAAGRAVVYKRLPGGWGDRLASLFRDPPALRSYRMGHALRLRGVPTPRPLAVWHARGDGHLLTDLLPDAVELLEYARTVSDGARRRAVIADAADAVRHLHARGASHRDLKAANLLVSRRDWVMGQRGVEETAGRRERVWLIDLVGVRLIDRVPRARRVRDLGRLYVSFHAEPAVSRTERLRFLRRYLGREGDKGEEWKRWWREVEQAGRAKIDRNVRRGRVVG